jgi:hypothetical protein
MLVLADEAGGPISRHAEIAKMTTEVQNAYMSYARADEEDGSITVIRDSAGSNTRSQPVSPGFQDKVI